MKNTRIYVNQVVRTETVVEVTQHTEDTVGIHIEGYTLQGSYQDLARIVSSAQQQLEVIGLVSAA